MPCLPALAFLFSNLFLLCVICTPIQERLEAKNLFASKQDEEDAIKESAKTFTPVDTADVPQAAAAAAEDEDTTHKVVAPTPEQITAIKVFKPLPSSAINTQVLSFAALGLTDDIYWRS